MSIGIDGLGVSEGGGGSGMDVSATTAAASDVRNGKLFYNASGNLTLGTLVSIDVSDTTAAASDVRNGKLFYNASGNLTPGTLVSIDVSDTTAAASDVVYGKSFYNANGNKVSGELAIDASKILYGQSIGGVDGTATQYDSAYPGDILNGRQAHARGVSVTGTIPLKGGAYYTPGISDQVIAAGQYLSGTQTIAGDSNLVSGNIRKDVEIFGVTGTYEGSGGTPYYKCITCNIRECITYTDSESTAHSEKYYRDTASDFYSTDWGSNFYGWKNVNGSTTTILYTDVKVPTANSTSVYTNSEGWPEQTGTVSYYGEDSTVTKQWTGKLYDYSTHQLASTATTFTYTDVIPEVGKLYDAAGHDQYTPYILDDPVFYMPLATNTLVAETGQQMAWYNSNNIPTFTTVDGVACMQCIADNVNDPGIKTVSNFGPLGMGTFSIWTKIAAGYRIYFGVGNEALMHWNNNDGFRLETLGRTLNYASSGIDKTKWHHYCCTTDGSISKLYIDGVLYQSGSGSGGFSGNYSMILTGDYYNDADICFAGARIYSHYIPAALVQTLAAEYSPTDRS